jgi:hypothetical protein
MQSTSAIRTIALAAAVALSLVAAPAAAHQIWIEQDAKGARLYFGEFGANLREDSPGLLDKFVQLSARLITSTGEKAVALAKNAVAYALAERAAKGQSLVAEETGYPSWEEKEGKKAIKTVWTPAARYIADFSVQAPLLTLDIVPTGKPGELQVIFRGKPLAEVELELIAASGWERRITTSAEGKVTVATPWKGNYLAVVHHTDKTAGKRTLAGKEEAYDVAMFVTTLSFGSKAGLAGPKPPAAAPPSE